MNHRYQNLCAVILAGGKGTRIENEDKPLIQFGHQTLVQWVLEKVEPNVAQTTLSVNHNLAHYEFLDLPLITDCVSQYRGPLAGIFSAMKWIENSEASESYSALVCLPADVPVFPDQLITQLWIEFEQNPCDVVYCIVDGQIQPLFSIWSLDCKDKIESALKAGLNGPKLLIPELKNRALRVEPKSQLDFLNINDTKSLKAAQELIKFV